MLAASEAPRKGAGLVHCVNSAEDSAKSRQVEEKSSAEVIARHLLAFVRPKGQLQGHCQAMSGAKEPAGRIFGTWCK
jgi:hypothetical protein